MVIPMNKSKEDKVMKQFLIVMISGEKYQVERESQEKLLSWLNTGHAGFLPIGSRDMVRFTPENVKEIIELVEEESDEAFVASNK